MHVITRKRLNEFAKLHPDTTNALDQWYRLMKQSEFASFVELREMFPSADQVGKLTVFNIGGIKFDSLPQFTTTAKKSTSVLC